MSDADYYAGLAAELNAATDTVRVLERIAEYASEVVACSSATVGLVASGGRLRYLAATSEEARRAGAVQYELHEGPAMSAVSAGAAVVTADAENDARWPGWGRAVAGLGVRSALSLPLQHEGRPLAVLQLFEGSRAAFGAAEFEKASLFARHAAVALASAHRTTELRRAIDSRTVIGQAQGILMERYGLGEDDAFQMLSRRSQEHNIKLRDVAGQLVRERTLPGDASAA